MVDGSREEFGDNIMQIKLNVTALALQDDTATQLDKVLRKIQSLQFKIRRYSSAHPLQDALADPLPDVVILELDGERETMLEDIRHFVEQHGQRTEVFVTFPQADLQLVKLLMRAGVRDVLPQPISPQDLTIALSNALARQRHTLTQALDRPGAVTAFMNTTGSAGGTFLAVNIAYLLATEFKKHTVLVDFDLQYGTAATDLNIRTDGELLDALNNPERIDTVFLDALITRHKSGLDVLPSPADLSAYDKMTPESVSRLISVLAETHDHVIIDLPTCINPGVEQALRLANPVFIVTQDSVPMLRNLKMMLERLPLRGIPGSHIEVIQNRFGSSVNDITSSELQELFRGTPVHRVHSDYKLATHAENEGKPAAELSSSAKMIKDMRAIASRIANPEIAREHNEKRGILRWFS